MLDVSSAAEALNSIASEEQRFHRIASAFRERADAHDNPVAQAIVWMLGYRLVAVSQQSARGRRHDPFAPDIEFPDFVFPPYLEDLSIRDDILSVWTDLTSLVESPAIKARLHDLLWVVGRKPDRYRHARNAIEQYLSAATPVVGTDPCVAQRLDSVGGLVRALELSRLIRAPELAARVCASAEEILASEIEEDDAGSRPGVWMPLLYLLADLDDEARPSQTAGRPVQLLRRPEPTALGAAGA